jgi:tRNA pseudouridine38-40 synthase
MAMRNLKLTLAYDGTRLVGWQRQAEGDSVQGLLEDALARFEGAPVTVHGAGRTDAGVHALAQVASVQLTCEHDKATLVRALNAQLPGDVRVLAIEDVPPEFHARFNARSKTYRYQIRHGIVADPFERAFVWHMPERLDVDAMREAASVLVGPHDFAAFQSAGSPVHDSVRTISCSEISDTDGRLTYEVSGTGFLRHMVRAIVGTLVEVGRGFREIDTMSSLLQGSSRGNAGPTAPPRGLFLVRVDYHEVLCRMRE